MGMFMDINSDIHEHIFDCDLLIIDDLGTELSNTFTNSRLFHCLNERLLRNKSTIISSNLSIADSYSPAVKFSDALSYKSCRYTELTDDDKTP